MRIEDMTREDIQALIDGFCEILDGVQDHHIVDLTGDDESADRIAVLRTKFRPLWSAM